MNEIRFPLSPDALHKHAGLHRRQEDLRLQQFRRSFNDDVFIDWPNRLPYRVAPTVHPRTAAGYLVAGQRAEDTDRGTPGVFVRFAGHNPPSLKAGELKHER